VKAATKEGIHHTIHGLKDFGRDSSWLVKSNIITEKYTVTSYKNDSKSRVIKQDVLKMIPFSAFLLIPGGELLLPAYLKVFPNSLPSQFVSGDIRKKKFHELHLL
jgi:LETM1 and EF-hand domain-containing protein 1